jgi:type IV secretion system protein TrbL
MCDNPLDCVGDVAGVAGDLPGIVLGTGAHAAVNSTVGSAFDGFVQSMVDSANWAVEKIMTLWLSAPDPDVSGSDSAAVWVNEHVAYLVMATMVGTMIYSGIRIALYSRSGDVVNLAETLLRTVLVSLLAGTLITTGLQVSDMWARWIVDEANLDLSVAVLSSGVVAQGVVLILALVVIITQVVQLGFMVVRNAVIVILAGTLTWAAAASGTQMGRQWFQKSISWLIAFILYKPTAALIYATAFRLASSDDLMSQLSGIFLMILSVFALPALMRLIMPVTAAIGGANAGALAGATVGAGVALGAMALTGGAAAAGGASGAGGFLGAGGAGGGGLGAGGLAGGGGPSGAGISGASPASSGGGGGSAPGGAGRGGGSSPGGAGAGAGESSVADLTGGVENAPSGASGTGGGGGESSTLSSVAGGDSESTPSGAGAGGAATEAPVSGGSAGQSSPGAGGSAGSSFSAGDALRGIQQGSGPVKRLQSDAEDIVGEGGPAGAGAAH